MNNDGTFNNEKYKRLIDNDEDPLKDYPEENEIIEDAEVIPADHLEVLKNNTFKGLPIGAEETIRSGRDLLKKRTEEAQKISASINELFNNLNTRFGFDLKWNPNSFSENLAYIMSLADSRAIEMYISEGYSKVRVVLYQQFLSAITALAAEVLDPSYLMSSSLSFDDKMTSIEKLFGFIEQMNQIYDQVKIDNVDEKLKHIKQDDDAGDVLSIRDPNVRKYLDSFRQSVLNSNNKVENQDNEQH